MAKRDDRRFSPLVLIATFKLVKSAFLLVAAAAVFGLIHHDIADVIRNWGKRLGIAPGNRYLTEFISNVSGVSDKQLRFLTIVLIVYAALFAIEGTGLLLRRIWAEYLTTLSTALLLPIEIYELIEHRSLAKLAIVIGNAAIVVYLISRLRRLRQEAKKTTPDAGV